MKQAYRPDDPPTRDDVLRWLFYSVGGGIAVAGFVLGWWTLLEAAAR